MADESSAKDDNFEIFRDCFFSSLIAAFETPGKASSSKRRHTSKKVSASGIQPGSNNKHVRDKQTSASDPSELAEFSDFVAAEVFESLPEDFQNLTHQSIQDNAELAEKWSLPLTIGTKEDLSAQIPPAVSDSLVAYGLIEPPKSDLQTFISPILASFITAATTPPPKWIATKVTACEICDRDWVPMTYHHLIPRGVHSKVIKRGWHDESMLNSVAWLCRACHTFVHKMASNEELAKEWYTVERICSREDTQKWAQWVGKVRWKKR